MNTMIKLHPTNVPQPLIEALQRIWQSIGPDVIGMVDDNECAIEVCYDASRLEQEDAFAYKQFQVLNICYGLNNVRTALAAHPQLQFV